MTLFIISVLLLAGAQSFCKLSLLPRKWSWGITAALFPLPFCFESAIASSNMHQVNSVLSSPATLENWCALAVIQELLVLTAGFSLLEDRQQAVPGTGVWKKALKFCKYAVFLPSLLCPAGILYLQMYLFNRFPEWDFRRLNWVIPCPTSRMNAMGTIFAHMGRSRSRAILLKFCATWSEAYPTANRRTYDMMSPSALITFSGSIPSSVARDFSSAGFTVNPNTSASETPNTQ